jgi:hypothetical protein
MDKLSGQIVDLVDVLGAAGRRLTEQLRATPSWQQRFALMDQFLLHRLSIGPQPSPEVGWAWKRLVASGGAVSIGRIAIERSRPAPADIVGLLSAGYRWDRPSTGVLLTDGVGEIELASAFRLYTELSYLARTIAVTADGHPIRSRHGLTFVPRADLTTAVPGLDRLVVPGADAARSAAAERLPLPERLTPIYLHNQPGFAFDGALRDIARSYDVATARWVAKTLQYPNTNPQLAGADWP